MKYAQYDQEGNIIAFYSPEVHSNIPSNTIEITDKQWQDCLKNQGRRKVDIETKRIIVIEPPESTEEELRQQEISQLESLLNERYSVYLKLFATNADQNEIDECKEEIRSILAELEVLYNAQSA